MPSSQPRPLHRLASIVGLKQGMGVTLAPILILTPARPAPRTTMPWRVEGRDAVAHHDRRKVPDTSAGLSHINSVMRNYIGEKNRYLSPPGFEIIGNKLIKL